MSPIGRIALTAHRQKFGTYVTKIPLARDLVAKLAVIT